MYLNIIGNHPIVVQIFKSSNRHAASKTKNTQKTEYLPENYTKQYFWEMHVHMYSTARVCFWV